MGTPSVAEHRLGVDLATNLFVESTTPFSLRVKFDAEPGVTVLFGPSGAGKTTVLDCIAGLRRPDAGRVVAGENVLFDSVQRIDVPVRDRRIGYVFQTLGLFPHMSVESNIQYGIARLEARERRRRAEAILESMRISALAKRRPGEISGGERQRVALARVLVTEPRALLLDEPMSALDAPTKSRIMDDLRTWNDEQRIPIVYVTHSREEVFALAEHVVVLEQGAVLANGSTHDVLEAPTHELTAQLAGFENILDAAVTTLHEDRGTMTCSVAGLNVEAPLMRMKVGEIARIGIRAGDILLATIRPEGISARNILPGRIVALTRRDFMTVAQVECGAMFEAHLTPQAQESLNLKVGSEVWLVIKTHSCHLLRRV